MDPITRPAPDDPGVRRALRSGVFAGSALGIVLASALLFGVGLGWTDVWAPDEPRYAAIAEDLRDLRHGARGLLLLHLNDEVYTQKPPLYFWLAALAGAPGSRVDEVAARLPSALAGVVSVVATLWIGRRLFGPSPVALLAPALLATSYRFVFVARRAQLDGVLTACLVAAMGLFLWLDGQPTRATSSRRFRLGVAALHAALGAAALTKGPVGWLPLAVFAAFLAWQGRPRDLARVAPKWAWLLSFGPLLAWAAAAIALAPPGYAEAAIGDNLFGRFFAGTAHARPIYYYLLQLPVDFLPWSLALPLGLVWLARALRARPTDALQAEPTGALRAEPTGALRAEPTGALRAEPTGALRPTAGPGDPLSTARLLTCWIAVPFVFFSLSAGKRGLYLLPIFPALALVTAAGLEAFAARFDPGSAATKGTGPRPIRRRIALAVAVAALLQALLFLGIAPLGLDAHKTPRPIAEAAQRHARSGEAIGVYRMPPLVGGLVYYGASRVVALADERALATFLTTSRGPVLLRTRDYLALRERHALEPVERHRQADRALTLARAAESTPPAGDPFFAAGSLRDSTGKGTEWAYTRAIPSLSQERDLPRETDLR